MSTGSGYEEGRRRRRAVDGGDDMPPALPDATPATPPPVPPPTHTSPAPALNAPPSVPPRDIPPGIAEESPSLLWDEPPPALRPDRTSRPQRRKREGRTPRPQRRKREYRTPVMHSRAGALGSVVRDLLSKRAFRILLMVCALSVGGWWVNAHLLSSPPSAPIAHQADLQQEFATLGMPLRAVDDATLTTALTSASTTGVIMINYDPTNPDPAVVFEGPGQLVVIAVADEEGAARAIPALSTIAGSPTWRRGSLIAWYQPGAEDRTSDIEATLSRVSLTPVP